MIFSPFRRTSDAARRAACLLAVASFAAALVALPLPAKALINNGEPAEDILGQFNSATMADNPADYVKGCPNDGASPFGFNYPGGAAIDSVNHWLFITDDENNRVLVFPLNSSNQLSSKTPSYVLGQTSFTVCEQNQGGSEGQSTLNLSGSPFGPAVDPVNHLLYVSDTYNDRILVFSTASMSNGENASYVIGATDFAGDCTGCTGQNYVSRLDGLALDPVNHLLYVADSGYGRVMVFPAYGNASWAGTGENALYVIGQSSFSAYGGQTTQSGLSSPGGLAVDTANDLLYVTDDNNNRVMVFPAYGNASWGGTGENALYEIGQPSGSSAFTSSASAETQSGLNAPVSLALDSADGLLFVSDFSNYRVMIFPVPVTSNGENASFVLGTTSFTSRADNTLYNSFSWPGGLAYDSTNHLLYVADTGDVGAPESYNRVMIFNVASGTIANGENATDLLGQYTSVTSPATVNWTQTGQNNGPNMLGLLGPSAVALDPVNHSLYVYDNSNNRVLVYSLNIDNSFPAGSGGHTASYVVTGDIFANSLDVDTVSDRLFVTTTYVGMVYLYSTPISSNNPSEIASLGHAFQTCPTQANMCSSGDVAYDSVNQNLYVSDPAANRVMVFNIPPGFTSGENAAYEFGQPSGANEFTTNTSATTQSGMNAPSALAFDAVYHRLFVADQYNNRVMVFSTASLGDGPNAIAVIGQSSFTASTAACTQSGMDDPDGLSYDPNSNRLFVADGGNNRILVFNAGPSVLPASGASAAYVLGQAGFTSCSANGGSVYPTQSGLSLFSSGPPYSEGATQKLKYDPGSGRLFVPDGNNNRVLIFGADYGHPDFRKMLPIERRVSP